MSDCDADIGAGFGGGEAALEANAGKVWLLGLFLTQLQRVWQWLLTRHGSVSRGELFRTFGLQHE